MIEISFWKHMASKIQIYIFLIFFYGEQLYKIKMNDKGASICGLVAA